MIPQMTVVADLTRSEDELSLKPGYFISVTTLFWYCALHVSTAVSKHWDPV